MPQPTILVTGANGFLGFAVCRAFSQAGWRTYGLMRKDTIAAELISEEITPIIGSPAEPHFVSSLPAVDVIATCSEDLNNYDHHFNDVLALIRQIGQASRALGGDKPLVIFSSGCKDYGMGLKHGEAGLAPHTEESPLKSHPLLVKRTEAAVKMLTLRDEFDCVVTRPTTFFGRSGSNYAYFFALAEQAKAQCHGLLTIPSSPDTILHGTHVDDVAAAYLAIATSPRDLVAGKAYNISGHRYETLGEIVSVMEKSHGITVSYKDPEPRDEEVFGLYAMVLVGWPQWVGSEKLRKDTGWKDRKPLFHEGYDVYRKAYEIQAAGKTEQFQRVAERAPRLYAE
ncbi:hypothetical protein PV04_07037 [Phialophora macrospora]|uniref:NAD-dependent epimerase/dehydratase domain-containing protein n=1 Tax=Phialophora macrospora TaxID=1851006 RepID=A0A0D2CRN0_9EURO|nr:hypothetical protein PV04_07037 [Phialophora macrospora]